VHKFKWYRRLPHYRLKAGNYLRRAAWLLRHGMLTGSARQLVSSRTTPQDAGEHSA
jgi:glycosyl transferase family 25